ncbi:ergosterol biosynthesis protein [Thelotrema lepadinum]|nr:ergosterol biosynthesis protein [Thelotrema lepadinum]
MSSLFPTSTTGGLLPYWNLLISLLATLNFLSAHTNPSSTLLIFAGPRSASQITPLAARNYGAWTLTSALVRAFAAYNINDKAMYALCLGTYVIVCADFLAEWRVYGTMRAEKRMLVGLGFAGVSAVWMGVGWGGGWYF